MQAGVSHHPAHLPSFFPRYQSMAGEIMQERARLLEHMVGGNATQIDVPAHPTKKLERKQTVMRLSS